MKPPRTRSDRHLSLETRNSRRLGYRTKSLVHPAHPAHTARLREAPTPSSQDLVQACEVVAAFEAARQRGEDRTLVGGQRVEVPTCRNALRLLAAP
jgi:citrate lyase subunit beta/citryl-CoA lyase